MQAVEVITDRAGDRTVEIAAWHGDWTPWNLAWDGGRLYAIDWEHFGRAPLGFDILHYVFRDRVLRSTSRYRRGCHHAAPRHPTGRRSRRR